MDIHQSLQKILASDDLFGTMFYDTFFERCAEGKEYFAGMDMQRQALVLTMALTLIAQHHTHGYAAVEQYLRHLGGRHKDRTIPGELYPQWRESMLVALERFHGDDWSETLSDEWRTAIDGVSRSMLHGYDEHTGI